ncbi:tumor protein p53-inducible nuclear protein 2 isoform X1 [Carcharodon carcharias]|uniref:tumor protein p53-inducible nuclear protein 2 isoform X1 n=1 Tax=Carcharodon carcharias TaxID=13397 RepID=UPI001B7F3946|nr:tumor protein p53-inducible nuclear protein 2 isoform X1 [Carcharodon carcharias]XP_041060812.1 tumor protein p53-inducible nuclear protein 2 isoform X1 [Carcharodon carcharias]XP_041060813.1 tumor protein p53-inducible nuclear protein 2 isoform X1 [Carcharodon carcharias]XP_041060814.1 tumor protein p53-inducible nuclear protein 2 isoform X1 [Carcharodon carcharias]XP_041060815.1 tumor protein p53-inducible nuclear protein 2 isoform X1 [Carcharodon carcharias]XP_041060816.1 tumor protein p
MFHRLTSLFYGETEEVCTQGPDPSLTEKEDDGWLIVDFPDDCTTPSSEEAEVKANAAVPSSCLSDESPPSASSSLESLCHCGSSSSPPQSLPCTLEESWFVTPPPCFTAEGQDEVQVESSPLENLLIEHPSMSVYAAGNTNISTLEEDTSEEINDGNATPTRMERWAAPAPAAAVGRASILEKASQVRRVQRAKQRVEKRQLSRNRIQRQNLARECRFHWTKHHGSFVYQPCRRQYNY